MQALNGGVNIALTPRTPAAFQKAGMLSDAGRCKTLDASADGYGRAEAVVAMLLATASYGACRSMNECVRGACDVCHTTA